MPHRRAAVSRLRSFKLYSFFHVAHVNCSVPIYIYFSVCISPWCFVNGFKFASNLAFVVNVLSPHCISSNCVAIWQIKFCPVYYANIEPLKLSNCTNSKLSIFFPFRLLCSLQVLLYHIRRNSSRVFRNFFQKKWVKIARNFVDYFVQLDKYKKV